MAIISSSLFTTGSVNATFTSFDVLSPTVQVKAIESTLDFVV
ncbi:hypothetical protein [Ornithobacterium rhinotracheale]|nr:hypothetical protein [Ornithobacterium rhinotracheale]